MAFSLWLGQVKSLEPPRKKTVSRVHCLDHQLHTSFLGCLSWHLPHSTWQSRQETQGISCSTQLAQGSSPLHLTAVPSLYLFFLFLFPFLVLRPQLAILGASGLLTLSIAITLGEPYGVPVIKQGKCLSHCTFIPSSTFLSHLCDPSSASSPLFPFYMLTIPPFLDNSLLHYIICPWLTDDTSNTTVRVNFSELRYWLCFIP